MLLAALRGNVQTHQCLSGPGHAGEKTDRLSIERFRLVDQFSEPPGRYAQILRARVIASNCLDRVLGVEGSCGLDDGRSGPIGSAVPLVWVDGVAAYRRQRLFEQGTKGGGVHAQWSINVVSISLQFSRRRRERRGRNENWDN